MSLLSKSKNIALANRSFCNVIQSEAKNLGNIKVNVYVVVPEILPPSGRLNDK